MQWILIADAFRAALAGAGSHLTAAFAALAQSAAPVAMTALWQGAAIAVALVLSLRLAPRVSAAHRFAAWAVGFAVVVGLPFLPLFAHSSSAAVAGTLPLEAMPARPWLQLDSRWGFFIAALWLAASAFRTVQLAFHLIHLRKVWTTATPVEADESLRSLLIANSPARRAIELCTTREIDRPGVIGFFAPRILIPQWLFSRLTPGELEQVVLHEAEHLRRRDDWTNLLQKLSLVLFPLNPALFWMERRLCREREMACDEGVVRRTQAPRAYAACLTSLAKRGLQQRELLRRAHALSLGAFERRPELVRRVHSILWGKQTLQPLAARALLAVVGCGLLFGSMELARCPQMVAFVTAQEPDVQTLALAPANTQAVLADRASLAPNAGLRSTGAAAGFRAIETKAILPASPSGRASIVSAAPRCAPGESAQFAPSAQSAQPTGAAEIEIASREASAAPRTQMAMSQVPASEATPAAQPEYIFLTAWEVTRTSTRRARAVADYDTGAAVERQSGAARREPASQTTTQITVTHFILAVYPATSAPNASASNASAPNPEAAHETGSHSNRPAPPSFDSGWLVFEL
jgi:beta-lactamase regulating signal transducer with metallopeptidase domain